MLISPDEWSAKGSPIGIPSCAPSSPGCPECGRRPYGPYGPVVPTILSYVALSGMPCLVAFYPASGLQPPLLFFGSSPCSFGEEPRAAGFCYFVENSC